MHLLAESLSLGPYPSLPSAATGSRGPSPRLLPSRRQETRGIGAELSYIDIYRRG